MVDFNSEPDKTFMSDFMELYNSKDLVKLPTYRKNPENHSSINLFLANRPGYFQDSHVFKTSIYDFHKLIVTVLINHFQKQEHKTVK